MYGGHTFNYELKCPAAWCLVAWQEQGLRALIEMAQRTQTTKNYSLSLQILAPLSAGERFSGPWPASTPRTVIESCITDWGNVFSSARVQLNELARSIASDDEAALYAVPSTAAVVVVARPDGAHEVGDRVEGRMVEVPGTLKGRDPGVGSRALAGRQIGVNPRFRFIAEFDSGT